MVNYILAQIRELTQAARDIYRVNPVIFLVVYFASVPFFYYSLFRMLRALARRRGKEIMLWSCVFLGATVAPFLYVLFFGRNLPWWVYGVIAVLIGQGVFSLGLKLRGASAAGARPEVSDPASGPLPSPAAPR